MNNDIEKANELLAALVAKSAHITNAKLRLLYPQYNRRTEASRLLHAVVYAYCDPGTYLVDNCRILLGSTQAILASVMEQDSMKAKRRYLKILKDNHKVFQSHNASKGLFIFGNHPIEAEQLVEQTDPNAVPNALQLIGETIEQLQKDKDFLAQELERVNAEYAEHKARTRYLTQSTWS